MKKTLCLAIALLLAFVFVSCDSNTPSGNSGNNPTKPLDYIAQDINVPDAKDFVDTATEDEIALMHKIINMTNYEDIASSDSVYSYKCLENAKINGEVASGFINMSGSEEDMTFKCSLTIGDLTYKTDAFRMKIVNGVPSFEGVLTCSDGQEYEGEEAFGILYDISQYDMENVEGNSIDNSVFKGADYSAKYSDFSKSINNDHEEKEYWIIEYDGHTVTRGKMDSNTGNKFLYLSLDGKYFTETVYDKVNSGNLN